MGWPHKVMMQAWAMGLGTLTAKEYNSFDAWGIYNVNRKLGVPYTHKVAVWINYAYFMLHVLWTGAFLEIEAGGAQDLQEKKLLIPYLLAQSSQ